MDDKKLNPELAENQFPRMAESTVHAGFPSPAQDYMSGGIDLNKEIVRHPEATFYVRVTGDSMIDAGISDGDVLVVDRSLEPRNGAIAVCFIDGEFLVRRLRFPSAPSFSASSASASAYSTSAPHRAGSAGAGSADAHSTGAGSAGAGSAGAGSAGAVILSSAEGSSAPASASSSASRRAGSAGAVILSSAEGSPAPARSAGAGSAGAIPTSAEESPSSTRSSYTSAALSAPRQTRSSYSNSRADSAALILEAANPAYAPIAVDQSSDFTVWGLVTWILKPVA